MGKFIDITGKRFGNLVVTKKHSVDSRGEMLWQCKCDCGNETITLSSYLRTGHTKSCGCLRLKANKTNLKEKHKRLYEIWVNMKTRCNNPSYQCYHAYGGKGIEVCDEWKRFKGFLEWALGSGYDRSLTLDRKDNALGYNPDNCRWANMQQQQNNRTNNRIITVNGKTKTMAEWARSSGILYTTIQRRLACGWPENQAVTLPADNRNKAIRRCWNG